MTYWTGMQLYFALEFSFILHWNAALICTGMQLYFALECSFILYWNAALFHSTDLATDLIFLLI
jgi:hypothetical protein